jgi:cytochrome c biogenesis protein CcdA
MKKKFLVIYGLLSIFILSLIFLHLPIQARASSKETCEGCDTEKRYTNVHMPSREEAVELLRISSSKGIIIYFYSPGCVACLKVEKLLVDLKNSHPQISIKYYNILDSDVQYIRGIFDEAYNVPINKVQVVPALFVGERAFIGEYSIQEAIKSGVILNAIKEKSKLTLNDKGIILNKGANNAINIFLSLNKLTILTAGILDGVNPCAFVTLIFFASLLLLSRKARRTYLLVGLSFIVGIFIAYVGIGVGLSNIFLVINSYIIAKYIYYIAGIVSLVLGTLNLVDYTTIKRGRINDMKLQLPRSLKKVIHYLIHREIKSPYILLASFGTGLIVSSLEFYCTGQIYLPIIAYITRTTSLRTEAIYYLLLYNCAFIIPLLGVFIVSYYTSNSQTLGMILKKHLSKIKLVTAGLFFLLGVYFLILLNIK